jgi:hypothetical protein
MVQTSLKVLAHCFRPRRLGIRLVADPLVQRVQFRRLEANPDHSPWRLSTLRFRVNSN